MTNISSSYVVLTVFSTFCVSYWHGIRTGLYRRAAKVAYPAAYASNEIAAKDDAAYTFNCAQRSHANFDEHYAPVMTALLISGTRYPIAGSVLGAFWVFNRVVYAIGYTRRHWGQHGAGRYYGVFGMVAEFSLYGLTAWTGWKMLS